MGPGWRQRPRTFAPQASVVTAGVREDVGHEYTCFMRGGEDACLHERFLRNKNAALPARAQKTPLTLSGLKKHGSRLAPAAANFRAPSECHGCRRTGGCRP